VTTVAIIPARGGSKGITDKNLQPVHGVPLVVRAIRSAKDAVMIDEVIVSTDSERIARVAENNGARVITRPDDLSGDEASSESALLHAIDQLAEVEQVVFIQCTSPFIDPRDLDRAVRMVASGEADCAFSGLEDYGFRWEETTEGFQPVGRSVLCLSPPGAQRLRQSLPRARRLCASGAKRGAGD